MVTKVGMQHAFDDAVKDLLELEYDAVEAYIEAGKRIKSDSYRQKLNEFQQDHRRHIQELSELLTAHDIQFSSGATIKQILTKGKVVIGGLIGDEQILMAMRSNEEDTNTAYERIKSHRDMWDDAEEIISRGLNDERNHKDWLDHTIKQIS